MSDELIKNLDPESLDELLAVARARGLARRSDPSFHIPRVDRSEKHPLSLTQQRIWFLTQMEGVSETYHISIALEMNGHLNRSALIHAMEALVERHESLRTAFPLLDGEPVQHVYPAGQCGFTISEPDVRNHSKEQVDELIRTFVRSSFDIQRGPLIRALVAELEFGRHLAVIVVHHLVSDGWSLRILVKELAELYNASVLNRPHTLPLLEAQYLDFSQWHRTMIGKVGAGQLGYWRSELEGIPQLLEIPKDYRRPDSQDHQGNAVSFELDIALVEKMKELGRRHDSTIFMILLAGWASLLARLTGQQDIIVGVPDANRSLPQVENMIGCFVNSLAIRIDASGKPTVSELLSRVRRQTLAAQRHKDVPFEQVVEAVRPIRSLAHSPIFQVMLSWEADIYHQPEFLGVDAKELNLEVIDTAKFDLTLALREEGGRILGDLRYATALFRGESIQRFISYFHRLLDGMSEGDDRLVESISIISPAERSALLEGRNSTGRDQPKDKTVHEIFQVLASSSPDRLAARSRLGEVTYGRLDQEANRLAHYLRELGVLVETPVAICIDRSIEMLVGLLAILKAGGFYVPLDPDSPTSRLDAIFQDCDPQVILTSDILCQTMRDLRPSTPVLDLCSEIEWKDFPFENPPDVNVRADQLAYLIYTSGSTGTPKGVMVEHRSIPRLVLNNGYADFTSNDCFAFAANPAFDAATLEIWGPLLNGGSVSVVDRLTVLQPHLFAQQLRIHKVTILWLTAGLFHAYAEHLSNVFASLRYLIVGGDVVSPEVATRVLRENPPDHLLNGYGPTETTTFASTFEISLPSPSPIPIGKPIGNCKIYILDPYLEPVPDGVIGELFIGGLGVARGYWKLPDLTAAHFVEDPFDPEGATRLYRSGDLGRWRSDGNIEFIGRNDSQVKIRGFRIELGEIEAELKAHERIREVAVILDRRTHESGALVAYYALVEGADDLLTPDAARTFLSHKLPEHMLPAAYVRVQQLPLTTNGKLDRNALPEPSQDAYPAKAYEAPVEGAEQVLADIWSTLLGMPRVGRNDNFFELGGHSLLAVRMMELLRRQGLEIDLRTLFSAPTLSQLAETARPIVNDIEVPPNTISAHCQLITPDMLPLVELSQLEIDAISERVKGGFPNIQDIYPLAPLQEGILFHHLLETEGDPYLLGELIRFDTRSRLDAYLDAFQRVIDRHDILRTAILWEQLLNPVQVVWRNAELSLEEVNLEGNGDAEEELATRCSPRTFRMDISQAPMLRFYAAFDSVKKRWIVMVFMHHLIADHSTMDVLHEEIEAYLSGTQEVLPFPAPFRNLVARARLQMSAQEHEEYFTSMLRDVTEPSIPYGLINVREDGTSIKEHRYAIDPSLAKRLRLCSRSLGVSAASIFHLAWGTVISRLSATDDVVFGTVLFGRMRAGEASDRIMGVFINTLPVRITLNDARVSTAIRTVHVQLADLLKHEHASLALAQRCSGVSASVPLFTSLLNYRYTASTKSNTSSEAWRGIERVRSEERTNYPLCLDVDDLSDGFRLKIQTDPVISPERICAYMTTALDAISRAIELNSNLGVRDIPILPDSERALLLREWNDTSRQFPTAMLLHELFEEQARRTPDAIALSAAGSSLTYAELSHRSSRVANHLQQLGVISGDIVGVCLKRDIAAVVGILGILKSGAAYCPLDPTYPSEHLRRIIKESQPVVILTESTITEVTAGLGDEARFIDLSSLWNTSSEIHDSDFDSADHSREGRLAYVIFTSGSTGVPKGAMITNEGMINHLYAKIQDLNLQADSVVAFTASLCFDISVWQMFAALLVGGRVLIVEEGAAHDPSEMALVLTQSRVTVFETVPSMLDALIDEVVGQNRTFPDLRWLLVTGEAFPQALGRRSLQQFPLAKIMNAYGPTECSDDVTHYVLLDRDKETASGYVPIGRPIANTSIYICDRAGELLPVGVAGEICVGGVGVGLGYLNRPGLTHERFVIDPYSAKPNAKMYKTGDLGRWAPSGYLEFLGRSDSQIKVRGYRIELGEIEAKAAEYPGVHQAVATISRTNDRDNRLILYYTPAGGEEVPSALLRQHLSSLMPEFMVPSAYIQIATFPLNSNGKIDKQALPPPGIDSYLASSYEEPTPGVEEQLAELWRDLLQLERVGRHDDFFELGGHSLVAVRLISRIRQQMGVELPISEVFAHPRLSDLASCLSQCAKSRTPKIIQAARGTALPLSFAQQRLWFLDQMKDEVVAQNVPLQIELLGHVELEALRKAFSRLIDRHEILRTRFDVRDGIPYQEILSSDSDRFHLREQDLRDVPDVHARVNSLIQEEVTFSFDIRNDSLIRALLIRETNSSFRLVITVHHIVSDGWSTAILKRELGYFYSQAVGEDRLPIPPLSIQYGDYAIWQRRWMSRDALNEQAEYWRLELAGAPLVLELPWDHPRPPRQNYHGRIGKIELDEELTSKLKSLARHHEATLFMILLAGWSALLSRLSGQRDILIGVPVAGRSRTELEDLIGFFVNTQVLRASISESSTVSELLAQVKAKSIGAQRHQDIPFEQVVELINPPRSTAHSPIFQVMFAWQNAPRETLDFSGLKGGFVDLNGPRRAQFDLTLALWEEGGRITGEIEYATALFEPDTIDRYSRGLQTLLQGMVVDDSTIVDRIPLLSPTEQNKLVNEWNATARPSPKQKCVHRLFEEQVIRSPDAPAVVMGNRELTYEELNRRANRTCRYLRLLGIGPGAHAAVCTEKNFAMVEVLLGVLKSGAACVPIDPDYPAERLAFILQDSCPQVIITEGKLRSRITGLAVDVPIIEIDDVDAPWLDFPDTNVEDWDPLSRTTNAAYLIYTSGSTGQPKGVVVEHRSWANLLAQHILDFQLDVGTRVLQFAPMTFDVGGAEVMMSLCSGSTLCLFDHGSQQTLDVLPNFVESQRINVVMLPSAVVAGLLPTTQWRSVHTMISGGDRLDRSSAQRWGQGRRLFNAYGPSEATVCTTLFFYNGDEGTDPPIGRPIGNARVYILDPYCVPVPIGVCGEIYIGGAGVARGYWRRPDLTLDRFLPDPFSGDPEGRMYKTGDLARWRSDGNIEFLGRSDQQVKVRGFRVELGEIEAQLAKLSAVQEVAVVTRDDSTGNRQLVAYYVPRKEFPAGAEQLREHLSSTLPSYMIPSIFVPLQQLPLTHNKKLDREALPAPDPAAYSRAPYEGPRGQIEETLAAIWTELLSVVRVGRHDDFFELGGHSLLAVRMMAEFRKRLNKEFSIRTLFDAPTISGLALRAVTPRSTSPHVSTNGTLDAAEGASRSTEIEITI